MFSGDASECWSELRDETSNLYMPTPLCQYRSGRWIVETCGTVQMGNSEEIPPLGRLLVAAGAALSPLWFLTVLGVNIIPSDLILVAVFVFVSISTARFVAPPDKLTFSSVLVFLGAAALSLTFPSRPVSGVFNFVQWMLIFVVIVPICIHVFKRDRDRYLTIIGTWAVLNGLTLAALLKSFSGVQLDTITLLYSNQNQMYWLIASGAILNMSLLLERESSRPIRLIAGLFFLPSVYLTVGGFTLSAILLLGVGTWLIVFRIVALRSQLLFRLYGLTTTIVGVVSGGVIVRNWEWIYLQASLESRFAQYRAAIRYGTLNQPFGVGIESSGAVLKEVLTVTSIHNYFLAFYIEIGIFGSLAFTALLLQWVRSVLFTSLLDEEVPLSDIGVIVIFFGSIMIMLFQPVPVRRFWWIVYALSWGVVLDVSLSDRF